MPRRGQTFIETLTAVLIIGILAGVLAPRLLQRSREAEITATIAELKTIAAAATAIRNATGDWPADGFAGIPPAVFDSYLRPNLLARRSPTGGEYDWDKDFDFKASFSIHGAGIDIPVWAAIDTRIDDGNAATGWVRYETAGLLRIRMILEP